MKEGASCVGVMGEGGVPSVGLMNRKVCPSCVSKVVVVTVSERM